MSDDKSLELAKEAIKETITAAKEFAGKLVNPGLEEGGGIIQDTIKFWRFKNQVNILIKAKKFLEENGVRIESFSLGWIPQNEIKTIQTNERERIEKLIDELTNHPDVNDVYSNLQLSKTMS